jgi:hypothetical protein
MSSTKAIVFILLPLLMTYVVAGDADAPAPTAGGSFRLNYCDQEYCKDAFSYLGYRSRGATCEIDEINEGRYFCCAAVDI